MTAAALALIFAVGLAAAVTGLLTTGPASWAAVAAGSGLVGLVIGLLTSDE